MTQRLLLVAGKVATSTHQGSKIPFEPVPITHLFAKICRRNLEGIVAKRKTGVYREDRQDWLKVKNPTYSQAEGRHDLFRR